MAYSTALAIVIALTAAGLTAAVALIHRMRRRGGTPPGAGKSERPIVAE